MSLARTSDLLREAQKGHYAVTAFDTFNYETIKMVADNAANLKTPTIVMIFPEMTEYISPETFAALARSIGEQSEYPVSVMLDHGNSFELAMRCIKAGFTSVMIDYSHLPYEENVCQTRRVVDAAHAMGVDVEAELGHTGNADTLEDYTDSSKYTDPDQAADFAARTGCDVLAVAFGSAHGNYVREPKLDLERLQAIREKVDVPLVLHGGTGIPVEQIQAAVKRGICKLNVGTGYDQALYRKLKQDTASGKQDPFLFVALQDLVPAGDAFLTEKIGITRFPDLSVDELLAMRRQTAGPISFQENSGQGV